MKIKEGFWFLDMGPNTSRIIEVLGMSWNCYTSPYKFEKTMWVKIRDNEGIVLEVSAEKIHVLFDDAFFFGKIKR